MFRLFPEPPDLSPVFVAWRDFVREKLSGVTREDMIDSGRKRQTLTGEQARQGRIVLNTPMKRMLFFGAFAAIGLFCVLTLVVAIASMAGR